MRIVASGGLEALTIARLAAESGVSNGSIYHHFGSRGGVLAALYRDSFQRCMSELEEELDDRPARDVVMALACRYLRWVEANQARAQFVYAASIGPDPAGILDDLSAFKAEVFGPIVTWMVERGAKGDLREVPMWALDPIVMGPAHECARRFLAAPDTVDLGVLGEEAATATWAILRP